MPTATANYPARQSSTLLGTSLVANSSFPFTPEGCATPVETKLGLRIAYSLPYQDDDEDLDLISASDLNMMPLTFSITEILPWLKYHDVWNFIGPNLESHGYAEIPSWANIPLTALTYDEVCHEDDRKIERLGKIISKAFRNAETHGLLLRHQILRGNPVYIGLRDNTYYKTRSQAQVPDEYLKFLGHEEIPLGGDLVVRRYNSWIFPPEDNSQVSDLELRIGLASLDADSDALLQGLMPLRFALTETFYGDLKGKVCKDNYLISPRGVRLSHSFYEREQDGSEKTGRDRTFSKFGDYCDPISIMLQRRLTYELEVNSTIQELREKKFMGGRSFQANAV